MTTIFVVMGTTGEYSDRTEWPVAAYADRVMADKHADQAMLWFKREMELRTDAGLDSYEAREAIERDKSPFDPNIRADSPGTDYFVLEVAWRAVSPEILAAYRLIVDADGVARRRGDAYGLCDSIDNTGQPYPSGWAADLVMLARAAVQVAGDDPPARPTRTDT
jgi:hypothetical protein